MGGEIGPSAADQRTLLCYATAPARPPAARVRPARIARQANILILTFSLSFPGSAVGPERESRNHIAGGVFIPGSPSTPRNEIKGNSH
jgi:hypothetical protein